MKTVKFDLEYFCALLLLSRLFKHGSWTRLKAEPDFSYDLTALTRPGFSRYWLWHGEVDLLFYCVLSLESLLCLLLRSGISPFIIPTSFNILRIWVGTLTWSHLHLFALSKGLNLEKELRNWLWMTILKHSILQRSRNTCRIWEFMKNFFDVTSLNISVKSVRKGFPTFTFPQKGTVAELLSHKKL